LAQRYKLVGLNQSLSGKTDGSAVMADGPLACWTQPGRLFALTAVDGCLPTDGEIKFAAAAFL